MLSTTDNAARRMQKLVDQLRDPRPATDDSVIDVVRVVQRAVERQHRGRPIPQLKINASPITARAQEDQLLSVIGHIVQNAQDATPHDGNITVQVDNDGDWATISVTDTGSGMDEIFVRERLFSPFDSTKGLTGMGIGAYQSREYMRSQGGDIRVSSAPGRGSTFVLSLPLSHVRQAMTAPAPGTV